MLLSLHTALAIECPSGCGMTVPAVALQAHASQHCPYRLLKCPLNCGLVFSAHVLREHMEECTERALTIAETEKIEEDTAKEQVTFEIISC